MADEDLELQAKIRELSGRIDRHKAAESVRNPPAGWVQHPGTPYGYSARGRGRGYRASPHKNRTLVLNGRRGQDDQAGSTHPSVTKSHAATDGWVSKRDRHMQLINTSVYTQKTQQRAAAMEETRKQKARARNAKEQTRIQQYLRALEGYDGAVPPSGGSRNGSFIPAIFVKGIRFLVTDGGSKLVKAKDEANMAKDTPKRTVVGGVLFVRSKHGNMYRAGLIQATRDRQGVKKSLESCPKFSLTGSCPKGPSCRYTHYPDKVAICRDFLMTGSCAAGDACDLSHDPTPERVPACLHFQRGNCTNPSCRFAHVHVDPAAPVCRAFATRGFCPKGADCAERHVSECPDYANKGICRNKKCRLPHVDRAGQLRKTAAAAKDDDDGEEAVSDLDSDTDLSAIDSDDVDSDDIPDEAFLNADKSLERELSQQQDFVHF